MKTKIEVNVYHSEDCDMEVLKKAMLFDPQFKNASFVSSDILLPELTETVREISCSTSTSRSSTDDSNMTTGHRPCTSRYRCCH